MKRKFRRSNKGFTLTEMLIAVALLAIFVSMAAVGTSSMFDTGEQMMTASKAAILGSDVVDAIANEIRFGEEFTLGDGSDKLLIEKEKSTRPTIPTNAAKLSFNSASYGDGCVLTLSSGGEKITSSSVGEVTLGNGNLILKKTVKTGDESSADYTYLPIGTAAYDEVYISNLSFTCNYELVNSTYVFKYIAFTVSISDRAKNDVIWSNTVNIEPLYFKIA